MQPTILIFSGNNSNSRERNCMAFEVSCSGKSFLEFIMRYFCFFYLWFLLFLERVRARVATFTNCAPAMIHHPPLLSSTGNNVFPSAVYFTDVMTSVALGATLSTQCHEAWGEGHRQTGRAVWTILATEKDERVFRYEKSTLLVSCGHGHSEI